MKGQVAGKLIMVALAVMVGAIMIPLVVNTTHACETKYPITVEWHNSTSNTSLVTVSHYPVETGSETIKAYNVTSGALLATLVKDSNYTVTSYTDGKFQMVGYGPTFSTANLSIDYTWHDACYIKNSGTRATVQLVSLLFILGIAYMAGKGFGVF